MKKDWLIFGGVLIAIVGLFGIIQSLPQGTMSVMASGGSFGDLISSQSFELKSFMLWTIVLGTGLVLFINQIFKKETK